MTSTIGDEQDGGRWAAVWAVAPVTRDSCRGCLERACMRKVGHHTVRAYARANQVEVRETSEGAYCARCLAALKACPTCGAVPVSHGEYPCEACERVAYAKAAALRAGRVASPTYRGWSSRWKDQGHDPRRQHRKVAS